MIRRVFAALSAVALPLVLAAAGPTLASAQTGRITGSVADSANLPLAGALVTVTGTSANLNLVTSIPGIRTDCTVDLWLVLTASSSVQRSSGTTASTGAVGFLQRQDNCTGELEFGSFSAALPATAFTTGSGTVTFNATFPITMSSLLDPDAPPVNRTLAAAVKFTNVENNSVASRSFGRVSAPGLVLITRSSSVYNAASVTGQLTLDGKALLTQASTDGSIVSGTSATIDITK